MKGQRYKRGHGVSGGEREGPGGARCTGSGAQGADISQTTGSVVHPAEGEGGLTEQVVAALAVLVSAIVTKPTAATPTPTSEPWLTVAEGARHAAISEETLREWVTLGVLPAGRCGRVLRVRRSEIDNLLTNGTGVASVEQPTEEMSARASEILATLHLR